MRVEPTGQVGAKIAIVGGFPEPGEQAGFTSKTGALLWPLLRQFTGLRRSDCWVTHVWKYTTEDSLVIPSTSLLEELWAELAAVKPERILAVGDIATAALLGDQFTTMRTVNGVAWRSLNSEAVVIPTWHPEAAMVTGGEDHMAWIANAISNLIRAELPVASTVPLSWIWSRTLAFDMGHQSTIAIDTEGTADDPFCLTFGWDTSRWFVRPEDVAYWWKHHGSRVPTHIYHNAPWDWAVMEAMGIENPERHPFVDTMELAYLKQTEPQALKDLAWRHLRIKGDDWMATVKPAWEEAILAYAAGQCSADTVTETLTKGGKPRKKVLHKRGPVAKLLYKAVENRNVELLAKKLPDFPAPNSNQVPFDKMVEYATLDPWLTYKLWEKLR